MCARQLLGWRWRAVIAKKTKVSAQPGRVQPSISPHYGPESILAWDLLRAMMASNEILKGKENG
ncbi:MAG: hypothetical protein EB015_10245 [Methylocystaceae bacterium]|nr:hypothetical protein [Methylocystaceae bacterium]